MRHYRVMAFLSGCWWIRGFLLSNGSLAFSGIQRRQVHEEDPDRGGLHLAGQGGHEEEGGELAQAVCQLHPDQPLSSPPRTWRFSRSAASQSSDVRFIKTSERKVNLRVGEGKRFNVQFYLYLTFTFFVCYGAVVVVCVDVSQVARMVQWQSCFQFFFPIRVWDVHIKDRPQSEGWLLPWRENCRYPRCRPSDSHSQSDVYKSRYQMPNIKDISDLAKSTTEDHYIQSNIDMWWRLKVEAACWQSSRIRWSVRMLQPGELLPECGAAWSSETFIQTCPSVFLSHWPDAPPAVRSEGAQRTWLGVLNSRCIECPKPVSMFLPGCFSLLILLPVDAEPKASVALLQPSTPPRLSFTKNNYKISGKKEKIVLWGFLGLSGCEVSCCSVPVIPVATQLTGLFSLPRNQTPSQVHRGEGSQVKFKHIKKS